MAKAKPTTGEQLAAVSAGIDKILAAVEADDRTLSAEERTMLDGLEKQANELEKQVNQELADRERIARQGERQKFLDSVPEPITQPSALVTVAADDKPVFKLPAEAKRYSKLKGFTGPDAQKDAYTSGLWFRANLFGDDSARKRLAEIPGYESLVMTGNVNTEGGFLIPEEALRAIIDLREDYGTFRQKVRVIPMGSDTLTVPRRDSGLTGYFVGEESSPTESEAVFSQVKLVCRTLATLTRISKELAEDAVVDLASMLVEEIAYAFATKEDQCGFLGTGASTYGGISGLITELTTATASTVTAATANTAYSTLDLADFESMVGKLPAYAGIRPEWYIHQAGWAASMMRLADAAGGNTATDIEGGRRLSFLGYPVNLVNVMNSTLTAQTSTYGLCYFGDLAMGVTMGDRRGIRVESDTSRYFEYRQIAIQGSERFDINVHDVGDTSNPGPVIMLATPAS